GRHGPGLRGAFARLGAAGHEAHARGLAARALVARRAFAGDEDEHAPLLVVTEPHLAHLPLGLAGQERATAGGRVRAFEALGGHHLLEPDEQGLDLRLLAGEREGSSGPTGEKEELARSRRAGRRDGGLVDRAGGEG